MSFEGPSKQKDDGPKDPGRRRFVLGAAAAIGAAAMAGKLGVDAVHEHAKLIESLTHTGKATVLDKAEKKGKHFTTGDIILNYMDDVVLYREGILGAAGDVANEIMRDSDDKYFLRLKIADFPPFITPVSKSIYQKAQQGGEVDVRYTTYSDVKSLMSVAVEDDQPKKD